MTGKQPAPKGKEGRTLVLCRERGRGDVLRARPLSSAEAAGFRGWLLFRAGRKEPVAWAQTGVRR